MDKYTKPTIEEYQFVLGDSNICSDEPGGGTGQTGGATSFEGGYSASSNSAGFDNVNNF